MTTHFTSISQAFWLIFLSAIWSFSRILASEDFIIFEDDFDSDSDGPAALCMLLELEAAGECKIIACGTRELHEDSTAAMAATLHYFGRGDIPLGSYRDDLWPYDPATTQLYDESLFCQNMAADTFNYGHTRRHRREYPDAIEVYAKALNALPPGAKAKLIIAGGQTNLKTLLKQHAQLVRDRVSELHFMGCKLNPKDPETKWQTDSNVSNTDPFAVKYVVENWPREIPLYIVDTYVGAGVHTLLRRDRDSTTAEKLADYIDDSDNSQLLEQVEGTLPNNTQGRRHAGLIARGNGERADWFQSGVRSDADEAEAWDTYSDTWVATDGLGRSVPGADEVGPPKDGRHVAMFYFLWMTGKGPVYDLNRMLAADPENPAYGPSPAFHFWAEPLFGYYRSDDEAVIRKHLQMLADAGVDVLCFDVTNALTYDDTYLAVCRVLEDMRRGGHRVPRIAFLANSHHERVVPRLYQDFYARNLHADLWFRWKGRPLLLTPLNGLDATVTNFFTLRQSWAWSHPRGWFGDGRDKWPWLDHTPQQFGWHESPDRPEQIPVAVAQHPTTNIGRSFQNGRQPPPDRTRSELGLYFAEQWARALEVDPELVFVTGWNEWIAQRFLSDGKQSFMGRTLPAGETFFVDAYNQEFSRDIEPMRGGYGDHYQYQLASYIRRYKGARTLPPLSGGPITVDGRFDDWISVGPEFRDTQGDPVQRDHPGWEGQPRFVNRTGRNDLVAAKVAANDTHVFFYVRTREPLTPATDPHWMHLFINADQNSDTGWLGYDYIVNRSGVRPDRTTLERNLGGRYQWRDPVDLDYRLNGNELELAIPRAALGLGQGSFTLDFKWADNCYQNGDWTDFTLNGDAAPNDRFNYRAMYQAAEESGDAVPQKPNVIFILADDQRYDELGCTGHPLIKTPNIDRLAQEGKLFVNSFTPSASCLPNRTSLLTGQWERRHTVGWNSRSGLSLEQWFNTLPMVLQRNGYVTAYVGKNHTPGLRPWDFDFYYGNRIGHLGFYPKKVYPIFNNASADTQPEILGEGASCFLQSEATFVDRAGDQATVFLRERDLDKPFFLYVCLNVPHSNGTRSMEQRESDDPLYRSDYRDLESQMPLPAGYIAEADVKTPKLPTNIYSGKQIPTYDYRRTPETLREQRVRVCQTVTGIDRIVGQLVMQLQRLGQADNTIIVYSSDNGILHGEHGYGGKCLLYEPSIRVPLIIYDPRISVPQRGGRVSELVVSPDVPSTILDLCGVTVPESMQGTSLRPLLQDESVPWRKDFFCESLILLQDYPLAHSVRSQDWKYIRYWPNRAEPADYREVLNLGLNGETPEYEELFHLAVDPTEQKNLAGDPQYMNQLVEMRARCTELLRTTRGPAEQLPTITGNEWNKEAPESWHDVLPLLSRVGAAQGE